MIEIIIIGAVLFLIGFLLLSILVHNYKERKELKNWAKNEISKEKELRMKAHLLVEEYKNRIKYGTILELEQILKAVVNPDERIKIEEEIEMLKGVISDEEV